MGRHWGFLLSGILAASVSVASQTHAAQEGVTNVRFSVKDQWVTINYDLIGKGVYEVSLGLFQYMDGKTLDHSSFLKQVWGDIGPGVKPGKGKVITWDAGFVSSLAGMDYFFEVRAVRPAEKHWWAWVVGSGAAGGAIGTAAWLKTRTKKGTIVIDVPDPEE